MFDINAMRHEKRISIVSPLVLQQQIRRHDYTVRFFHKLPLESQKAGLIRTREFRILIDAVIHQRPLAQGAGDFCGCRNENPCDRVPESELATYSKQAPPQGRAIDPSAGGAAMKRKCEWRENVNAFVHPLGSAPKLPHFSNDPLQIGNGCFRPAYSDGVNPQHAVAFCETLHDVFFTKGIAVPIVTEADDVPAFDHMHSMQTDWCNVTAKESSCDVIIRDDLGLSPMESRFVQDGHS